MTCRPRTLANHGASTRRLTVVDPELTAALERAGLEVLRRRSTKSQICHPTSRPSIPEQTPNSRKLNNTGTQLRWPPEFGQQQHAWRRKGRLQRIYMNLGPFFNPTAPPPTATPSAATGCNHSPARAPKGKLDAGYGNDDTYTTIYDETKGKRQGERGKGGAGSSRFLRKAWCR